MSHTPGPWEQVEYDGWLYIGADDMYFNVQPLSDAPANYAVENAICVSENTEKLSERDYANANLIAASPDLLESLYQIRGLGCHNYTTPQYGACITARPDGQYAEYSAESWCDSCIAHNAIAKAKPIGDE